MHKLILAFVLITSPALAGQHTPAKLRLAQLSGMTCFLTGEQEAGMNKICYYDCAGSAAAITVNSVSLCPLTINR